MRSQAAYTLSSPTNPSGYTDWLYLIWHLSINLMLVNPDKTSIQIKHLDVKRHQWISIAAYYKSELRGFLPGKELDDWLEAEQEYTKFQIKAFLIRCNEDGGMSITDLQRLAYTIGVAHPELINTKKALVREIQSIAQHAPCFEIGKLRPCDDEVDCQWRTECRKLIAIWCRKNN